MRNLFLPLCHTAKEHLSTMSHPDTESIYTKYGPQLYAYAKRFIPDDAEAVRLIIQWAFSQYEKKDDKIRMTDKATGIYLRLIARNLITNYFHSKVSHGQTQKSPNVERSVL